MSLEQSRGIVQLVCSPIGNLGDITYRAVEALKQASLIACEDTRHSRRLLQHYDIDKPLIALHEHNETAQSIQLVERVAAEQIKLCYLTDAGSPGISDPGYRLVEAALQTGVKVEVLPGPSAVTTALAGSGMPPDHFSFSGFLPVKSGRKESTLREALDQPGTAIFFESPHRIIKTLLVIDRLEPERQVCVARELTKKFETYHRGTAQELITELDKGTVKGEITLLIEGLTRKNKKKSDRQTKQETQ